MQASVLPIYNLYWEFWRVGKERRRETVKNKRKRLFDRSQSKVARDLLISREKPTYSYAPDER